MWHIFGRIANSSTKHNHSLLETEYQLRSRHISLTYYVERMVVFIWWVRISWSPWITLKWINIHLNISRRERRIVTTYIRHKSSDMIGIGTYFLTLLAFNETTLKKLIKTYFAIVHTQGQGERERGRGRKKRKTRLDFHFFHCQFVV